MNAQQLELSVGSPLTCPTLRPFVGIRGFSAVRGTRPLKTIRRPTPKKPTACSLPGPPWRCPDSRRVVARKGQESGKVPFRRFWPGCKLLKRLAPQVGLERDPEIATARAIVLNFRSDTRKINTYAGFDLYQQLPQKSLKTAQIAGRQYRSSTFCCDGSRHGLSLIGKESHNVDDIRHRVGTLPEGVIELRRSCLTNLLAFWI